MLNTQHFLTFLSIYRLGSQTKAAKQVSLTQPALSQHLKSLETHIGRSLFLRSGRKMIPTTLAHELALAVSPHLDALDHIWADLNPKEKTLSGTVYLGGISEFFATVVAPYLSPLYQEGITLNFDANQDELLDKLLRDELDLAQFCNHVSHPGITIEKLFHEEFFLVGAPSFAKKLEQSKNKKGNTLVFDQLPWVAYGPGLIFIKDYYHTLFKRNFSGQVALFVKDLWSIEAAVVGGVGVTVLPSYFCDTYLKNNRLVVLHKPKVSPNYYFYLAWKEGAIRNQRINRVRQVLHYAASRKSL